MQWKTGAGSRTVSIDGQPVETKQAPGRTGPPELELELSQETRAELAAIAERVELQQIRAKLLPDIPYVTCPPSDPAIKQACKALVASQAAKLGIRHIPLTRFFTEVNPDEQAFIARYGTVDLDEPGDVRFSDHRKLRGLWDEHRNTIFVHADLGLNEALETALHELGHAAGLDEDRAQLFEAAWAPRLPRTDEEDR
jgi:hypothetical protein